MTLEELALELVERDLVATVVPLGPDWVVHVQQQEDLAAGVADSGWVGKGDELELAVRDVLSKYDARGPVQ